MNDTLDLHTASTAPISASHTSTPSAASPAPQRKKKVSVPSLIMETISINVSARLDPDLGGWVIPGFYKAGGLLIKFNDNSDEGIATPIGYKRAKVGHVVKTFDDLVELNYSWWCASRKENVEFEDPSEDWKDEFVERQMLERKMIYSPKAAPVAIF
jgi:hypothetical protein